MSLSLRSLLTSLLPTTLRGKLLVTSLVVVTVPIAVGGYLMEREGRHALLAEKQEKLFGLTRLLDAELGSGFDQWLPDGALDRDTAVRLLNARLAAVTDRVAAANPGVGVGYYSKALNAIVTYGPSAQYGDTVGTPIPADHPGWEVLRTGTMAVETGPQVRGLIMNAMAPVVRGGTVTGYIWANELADTVERQASAMDRAVLVTSGTGIVLGLLLTQLMSNGLTQDVKRVTRGLVAMRSDLSRTIDPPGGEIGEIAGEVNTMARALLDARTLTENILNSIADGVVAVDGAGRVTSINPTARAILGVAGGDVIGRPYPSLFDPHVPVTSALLDTLESGQPHLGVAVELHVAGQVLHLSASSSLLRDSHGERIGAVVVIKDMTEQARLNTQIMRADRLAALGELMAGVAHEIRNPLTSIRGFMQFLEGCDDLKEWQDYAPLIVRQVDSLNRIITELLEFGRSRPPSVRPVQLNEMIREVTLLADRKGDTRITLDLAADLPLVEADGEALKQAILNLVINAFQAIAEGGTVRIATAARPGAAVVTVGDDGCGIAAENLEKVFDPFFSTKANGTGLGLAMVHRIVDAHRGTIAIASTPGAGTTVTLRLPFVHTATAPS